MTSELTPTVTVETGSVSNAATKHEIETAFAELNFKAEVQNAEYASAGPIEIMQYIVLSAPVLALFNAIVGKAGEDAYREFKRLCQRIFDARRRSYARESAIELTDTQTGLKIPLTLELSDRSIKQLLDVTANYLSRVPADAERRSGPRLEWSDKWDRWIANVQIPYFVHERGGSMLLQYRAVRRRFPPARSRRLEEPLSPPRQDRDKRLETYIDKMSAGPIIPWQRACFVYAYHSWTEPSIGKIAHEFVVSDELVLAVTNDFELHGLRALDLAHDSGVASIILDDFHPEVIAVAQSRPSQYGHREKSWSVPTLADFLVLEGVLEDVSHDALVELLADSGVVLTDM